MPTITRVGEFRFFFYSLENSEPAHVHVERGRSTAKFWLSPVRLSTSRRFRQHELNQIERIVRRNVEQFEEAWDEHFDRTELFRHQRDSDR